MINKLTSNTLDIYAHLGGYATSDDRRIMARELLALRKLAEDMATGIEDYPQRFANTEIALASYRAEYPKEGQ